MVRNMPRYVYIYRLAYTHICPHTPVRGPRSNNILVAPRSYIIFQQNGKGLLGEVTDSKTRAENIKDGPGTFSKTIKKRSANTHTYLNRVMKVWQENTGANKRAPSGQ